MDEERRALEKLAAQGDQEAYQKLCIENCRRGNHEWSRYTNMTFTWDFEKIVKPVYPSAKIWGSIWWARQCFWCGSEQRKVTFDVNSSDPASYPVNHRELHSS